MPQCLIGLGSNLGDRGSLLDAAITKLAEVPHVEIRARSRFHETPPVGGPAGQGSFLNAAVLIETPLAPHALLAAVARIETDLGRRRVERWGPRPIDLDLLLYDNLVLRSENLHLPHPRMAWRRFVLVPAAEVAPRMQHPTIGWTIAEMLDHLDRARSYVAIAGPGGAGKRELARTISDRFGGMLVLDPAFPPGDPSGQINSYGVTPDAELEFAKRRAKAVAVDSTMWNERHPLWVSDFWVGQSAAAIQVLSEGTQRELLLKRWHDAVAQACPPKLTVLLDVPAGYYAGHLVDRGTSASTEERLTEIDTIGRALMEQVRQPGLGPVLELDGRRPADAVEELAAAVSAMQSSWPE